MKRLLYFLLGVILVITNSCRKDYEAPVPYTFTNTPGAGHFVPSVRQAIEGVYTVTDGSSQFGSQVALKWTYVLEGTDTTHYLSVFTGRDVGYFNLEIDSRSDSLALRGYWRKLVNVATGLTNLTVRMKHEGRLQPYAGRLASTDTLVIDGMYGEEEATPTQKVTLIYNRPLNRKPFAVLAHRSGGRTSDLLPASENSVEIIKLASRFGATGIEIDVRYTKDGVPVLYHDDNLNLRLIKKNGLTGPISDYTYQQLSTLVRLVNGEKIPTLEEALETVINNTPIDFVWLDTKYIGPMDKVQAIQQKYQQKAALVGRNVQIIIGLPSTSAVDQYRALANKDNTPVLCELDTAVTHSVGARIWAPRWTLGPQTQEVLAMKAEGLKVFVWTLDEPKFIEEFVGQNSFDGILSNYSPAVAYYHYTEQ